MTHPIPAAALRESVAIVGRTGSGKSYAAKGAVELLLADGARVCIIDPTGVWHGLRSSASGTEPGFPIVVFGGDHGDVVIGDASGAAVGELLAARNLPAIVDVSEFSRSGMVRFMGPFLDALYRHNPRIPLTLVIDEADIFAPQRPEPDTATMLGRMEQIVRRGRVRGFRPWLITQRPASLNKNVLSQASTLIAMQLTAPQDRDAIGAWIEGQADRDEGKKVLAALPKLQKGEGYVWSPSHDVLERVRFPKITTFDSGRTPEDGEALPPVTLAAVDLAGIADTLQTVEQEAQDSDPKVLRARIKELEREAKKPREFAVDVELLARERQQGKREGYGEAIKQLLPMIDRMQTLRTALDEQLGGLVEDLGKWRERYAKSDGKAPDSPYPTSDCSANVPAPVIRTSSGNDAPRHSAINKTGADSTNPNFSRRAERMVLAAIARYPQGRSTSQAAILAGYAKSGGGFRNALTTLKTRGFLTGDAARWTATTDGIAALGDFEPLPRGKALLAHWLQQLDRAAERRVLQTLAEAYPHGLSVPAIANRSGYEPTGGGFRNAIGKLRMLELITGRAEIRASEALFD